MTISKRFELVNEDKKKLLKSLGWGILAVVATFIADYLQQYGLPSQLETFAPLTPVVVNALIKWVSVNKYK